MFNQPPPVHCRGQDNIVMNNEKKPQTGTCEHCGIAEGEKVFNPYLSEVDGVYQEEFICKWCYEELNDDV